MVIFIIILVALLVIIIAAIDSKRNSNEGNVADDSDLAENKQPTLIDCPACGNKVSSEAPNCPRCGQPIAPKRCPCCGSKNIEVISGADKTTSIALFGILAANNVLNKYRCKDCGHKF